MAIFDVSERTPYQTIRFVSLGIVFAIECATQSAERERDHLIKKHDLLNRIAYLRGEAPDVGFTMQ